MVLPPPSKKPIAITKLRDVFSILSKRTHRAVPEPPHCDAPGGRSLAHPRPRGAIAGISLQPPPPAAAAAFVVTTAAAAVVAAAAGPPAIVGEVLAGVGVEDDKGHGKGEDEDGEDEEEGDHVADDLVQHAHQWPPRLEAPRKVQHLEFKGLHQENRAQKESGPDYNGKMI